VTDGERGGLSSRAPGSRASQPAWPSGRVPGRVPKLTACLSPRRLREVSQEPYGRSSRGGRSRPNRSRGENNGHDLPADRRAHHPGRPRCWRGWRSCGTPNASAVITGVTVLGPPAQFLAHRYPRHASSRDHAGTGEVVIFTSSMPSISDTWPVSRGPGVDRREGTSPPPNDGVRRSRAPGKPGSRAAAKTKSASLTQRAIRTGPPPVPLL
jgi:hypothetical protein